MGAVMEVADSSSAAGGVPYILVHSDREIRRLKHQADIVNPITRRILLLAGLRPGMRVLDVGCGGGDVTLLAADIVGEAGHVVGIDRAPAALKAAEARAASEGIENVSFREGDPLSLSLEAPFDAAIGRYVLMFQAEPAGLLRALLPHMKPGGIVAFHEPDWDGCFSRPPTPAYERCRHLVVETFRRCGIETNMGLKLDTAYRAAGLAAPTMHMEAVVGGKVGGLDWVHQFAELVVTMLPEIESRGVAAAAEVDVDTLETRLRREIEAGCVIVGRAEIGAWAKTPADE